MKVVIAVAFDKLIVRDGVCCNSYAKFSKWGFVAENINDVSAHNSKKILQEKKQFDHQIVFQGQSVRYQKALVFLQININYKVRTKKILTTRKFYRNLLKN